MDYNTLLIIMTVIFSLSILLIGAADLIKKKYSYFIENMVSYILYLIFLAAQYRFNFRVTLFIILLVQTTIIGNNLIGKYFNFYYRSQHFDKFLHAFGAFSYSLFFYDLLDKITVYTLDSKLYVSLFVTTIGISFGCLYEIYEFMLDSAGKSTLMNQHGLQDTNFDLIFNVIGAALAGILSLWIFF